MEAAYWKAREFYFKNEKDSEGVIKQLGIDKLLDQPGPELVQV